MRIVGAPNRDALEGLALQDEQQLQVGAGGQLTLDFNVGARVTVYGPAYAKVSDDRDGDELLLREGTITVELPPGASRPKASLAVVTPSLRMQIVRSGALALRASADEVLTTVYAVAGTALLQMGALLRDEAVSGFQLAAGEVGRGMADGRLQRIPHASRTLDAALKAISAEPAASMQLESRLEDALVANVAELEKAQRQTRALQERHREQVAKGAPARMETQAELARHAAVVARISARQRLLTAQLEAKAMH